MLIWSTEIYLTTGYALQKKSIHTIICTSSLGLRYLFAWMQMWEFYSLFEKECVFLSLTMNSDI